MIKHSVLSLGLLFCLSWSAARAAEPETNPIFEKTGPNAMQTSAAVQVEAQVVSVNKKTREIKLKSQDGEMMSIVAGDEVKNFAQIKKGDHLRVRYFESLALQLKKGGGAPIEVTESTDAARAQAGQKPGGMVADTITARGTVTKVDSKTQSVTVKGPKRTVVLHIAKKDVFDDIKKGDQIEATYTEALAISVESVKK